MPLTAKGSTIKSAMEREYGANSERVFYASKNAGTITGVDAMSPGSAGIKAAKEEDRERERLRKEFAAAKAGPEREKLRKELAEYEGIERRDRLDAAVAACDALVARVDAMCARVDAEVYVRAYPSYSTRELEEWLLRPNLDSTTRAKTLREIEARKSGESKHKVTPQVESGFRPVNKIGRM